MKELIIIFGMIIAAFTLGSFAYVVIMKATNQTTESVNNNQIKIDKLKSKLYQFNCMDLENGMKRCENEEVTCYIKEPYFDANSSLCIPNN